MYFILTLLGLAIAGAAAQLRGAVLVLDRRALCSRVELNLVSQVS